VEDHLIPRLGLVFEGPGPLTSGWLPDQLARLICNHTILDRLDELKKPEIFGVIV
jgi:hypothetical protein